MSLFLRVFIVLLVIAVIAAVAAWLVETPGAITLEWRDWRIDTSVAVLVVFVVVLFVVSAAIYQIWRLFRRAPKRIVESRAARKREDGYLAMTRGMVAIAAGDAAEARRQAKKASEVLGRPPGALLIGAQAAQLEGKPGVARKFYEAMLETRETELLGVRGLLTLAEQSGDDEAALALAEKARALSPQAPWALTRLFQLQIKDRRWEDAEATLREAMAAEAVSKEEGLRRDAALLVQLSLMAERAGNRRLALDRARKAQKTAPDFLPATLQLVALQHADGRDRAARRAAEEAWRKEPHPDLARLYLQVEGGDDPMLRQKAAESLAELAPDARETHLMMARAQLDAKLWGQARKHLEIGGGDDPDTAFCRLFAELEQSENGDAASARDWLSRAATAPREPAWLCSHCSATAQEWSALCGHCGTFDTLRWTTPPRVMPHKEDGHSGEVLNADPASGKEGQALIPAVQQDEDATRALPATGQTPDSAGKSGVATQRV